MSTTLAGPAASAEMQRMPAAADITPAMVLVREAAARLYSQGYTRPNIARMLTKHLTPASKLEDDYRRFIVAKNKLARWEKEQEFRDLIWDQAVVKTDLAAPQIMAGVVKKAIKGNVLAARLALEVTGRHNPKGESTPSQIAIVFSDMVRPQAVQAQVNGQAVDAGVVDQVDDDED